MGNVVKHGKTNAINLPFVPFGNMLFFFSPHPTQQNGDFGDGGLDSRHRTMRTDCTHSTSSFAAQVLMPGSTTWHDARSWKNPKLFEDFEKIDMKPPFPSKTIFQHFSANNNYIAAIIHNISHSGTTVLLSGKTFVSSHVSLPRLLINSPMNPIIPLFFITHVDNVDIIYIYIIYSMY